MTDEQFLGALDHFAATPGQLIVSTEVIRRLGQLARRNYVPVVDFVPGTNSVQIKKEDLTRMIAQARDRVVEEVTQILTK